MSSVLDKVVDTAVENYHKQDGIEKALDPATISIFLDLILQIMSMFKDCKKDPGEAAGMMKNPTILQRLVARRTVRKNLDYADRQYGPAITEALLDTGKTISKADVVELYKEV